MTAIPRTEPTQTASLLRLPVLEDVSVASPCHVPWESMLGTDRVRHCGDCDLNVYNLSGMTRGEAVDLVTGAAARGGRTCIRFFKRTDGTMLTTDCPVGVSRARRRAVMVAAAIIAFVGTVSGIGPLALLASRSRPSVSTPGSFQTRTFQTIYDWISVEWLGGPTPAMKKLEMDVPQIPTAGIMVVNDGR